MKRVSILLITLALVAGTLGCGPTPPVEYGLTMAVNPAGNGTATDLTDSSPYPAGAAVNIEAVAAEGYRFVNWSVPAGTFANATAAETTFTMPAQNVTVTANFAPFAGGSGTAGNPYQIADWYQLHNIRNYLDSSFILVNNLDSTTAGYTERASPTANGGKGWQPIGSIELVGFGGVGICFEFVDPFTGTFDGQGYDIRDLFIDRPDLDKAGAGVGLFGAVDVGGVIENVRVLDADVTGCQNVGILVGGSAGTVSSSCSSGSASGWDGVGGLMGVINGSISDSYSTASVTGDRVGGVLFGGLVGGSGGTVSNSYASGNVTGGNIVGGLVGNNYYGTVSNSYSNGNVTGYSAVGGLVGANDGTVTDSFWDTETSGQATSDGGTGENTTEMQDFTTFSGASWDIVAVANSSTRNTGYFWNIVDDATYPFLSWQP